MENIAPEAAEATQFWSNIWSNPVTHRESVWLEEVKNDLGNVEKQDGVRISISDLQKQSSAQLVGKALTLMAYMVSGSRTSHLSIKSYVLN